MSCTSKLMSYPLDYGPHFHDGFHQKCFLTDVRCTTGEGLFNKFHCGIFCCIRSFMLYSVRCCRRRRLVRIASVCASVLSSSDNSHVNILLHKKIPCVGNSIDCYCRTIVHHFVESKNFMVCVIVRLGLFQLNCFLCRM
jgi:hypothetical protein